LLLVVDGGELLLPAVALLVVELLRAAPGLRVLATSREAVRVAGEFVYPVAPLPVPVANRRLSAAGSLRYPAVALFVERASAVNAEFVVDDDNAALVAGLCQRLDGLPLAIELAAVRVRSLSLAQIAQRLDDRFELLTTGNRAGLARHQTLRAAVDWSFELCSKSERVLWMRAVVFAGGFDLAAAERVCGADGLAGGELVVALDGLVAKSVLLATDGVEGRRYRLLDTLSLYGLERLRRPIGDHGCVGVGTERFHADWFGPGQARWSERMRGELANLRAALGWCLSTAGETRAGLRLAGALHYLWYACGQGREGRLWLERLLAADPHPSRDRIRAQRAHLRLLLMQGEHAAAAELAGEFLLRATRFDDAALMSDALIILGYDRLYAGDPATAIGLLQQAVARAIDRGPVARAVDRGAVHPQVAYAKVALAVGFFVQGDPVRAGDLLEQSRAICRAHGDQWYLSQIQMVSAQYATDLTLAAAYARESLKIQQALSDPLGTLGALEIMARIAGADHDHRRAARLLGAADQQRHTVGGSPYDSEPLLSRQQTTTAARAALGDAAFDAEFQRGYQLTVGHDPRTSQPTTPTTRHA